jgi:FtsH-binding integral membrane protein
VELSTISKAIGGGIAGAIIALAAHFGFQPDAPTATALAVVVTAVTGYVVGHVAVYFAPKNK